MTLSARNSLLGLRERVRAATVCSKACGDSLLAPARAPGFTSCAVDVRRQRSRLLPSSLVAVQASELGHGNAPAGVELTGAESAKVGRYGSQLVLGRVVIAG